MQSSAECVHTNLISTISAPVLYCMHFGIELFKLNDIPPHEFNNKCFEKSFIIVGDPPQNTTILLKILVTHFGQVLGPDILDLYLVEGVQLFQVGT